MPTEPGFYKYRNCQQSGQVFVLTPHGQWRVISQNGAVSDCHPSAIERWFDTRGELERI